MIVSARRIERSKLVADGCPILYAVYPKPIGLNQRNTTLIFFTECLRAKHFLFVLTDSKLYVP